VAKQLVADETKAAVVWPCRNSEARGAAEIQVEMMPAVTQVFNPSAEQWESTPPRRVTLLATSGRLVGVTSKSRNAASAFRLAGWLASPEIDGQLIRESNGMAICRASQRRMADNWLGSSNVAGARQFSEQAYSALMQRDGVPVPRLPGVERYLELLADAVRSAADGKLTPAEALDKAQDDWESITDQLGRSDQRRAYLRCLGMDKYD
jgi:ABC-type glycerol-3-phosphate transport system substrate-binding protein